MKQAIEEGFILDVLQNYTTYDTFYQINKEIEEDPRCKTVDAKRQIARFVELHETNIAQRVEVIVEHFRTTVLPELGGTFDLIFLDAAKAQYITFLPYLLKLMKPGSVLLADNVLQDGELVRSRYVIPRRQRTIHTRMRQFLWEVTHCPALTASVLSIGDGVMLAVRK